MKYCIARSNCGSIAPERLPGKSYARLECGPVHVDADPTVRVHSGNQKSTCCKVKICLTVLRFGDGCDQCPRQSEV